MFAVIFEQSLLFQDLKSKNDCTLLHLFHLNWVQLYKSCSLSFVREL